MNQTWLFMLPTNKTAPQTTKCSPRKAMFEKVEGEKNSCFALCKGTWTDVEWQQDWQQAGAGDTVHKEQNDHENMRIIVYIINK